MFCDAQQFLHCEILNGNARPMAAFVKCPVTSTNVTFQSPAYIQVEVIKHLKCLIRVNVKDTRWYQYHV